MQDSVGFVWVCPALSLLVADHPFWARQSPWRRCERDISNLTAGSPAIVVRTGLWRVFTALHLNISGTAEKGRASAVKAAVGPPRFCDLHYNLITGFRRAKPTKPISRCGSGDHSYETLKLARWNKPDSFRASKSRRFERGRAGTTTHQRLAVYRPKAAAHQELRREFVSWFGSPLARGWRHFGTIT